MACFLPRNTKVDILKNVWVFFGSYIENQWGPILSNHFIWTKTVLRILNSKTFYNYLLCSAEETMSGSERHEGEY